MIKPTVGRAVWYWPSAIASNQPLAAFIAHVWSDTCVDLAIFDANGKPMENPPTSILLLQEGNQRPSGHFCEWMPYQIGQAKKHAETNAELAS